MIHVGTVQVRLADGHVRYRCSCGHVGTQWYANSQDWLGVDHARKAFRLHAEYADDKGEGPTYSRTRTPAGV